MTPCSRRHVSLRLPLAVVLMVAVGIVAGITPRGGGAAEGVEQPTVSWTSADLRELPTFKDARTGQVLAELPLYATVIKDPASALRLARSVLRVGPVPIPPWMTNSTGLPPAEAVVYRVFLLDNTGCTGSPAYRKSTTTRGGRRDDPAHFESLQNAATRGGVCDAWPAALRENAQTGSIRFVLDGDQDEANGAEVFVLRPTVPLPFATSHNFILQHALRMGYPRFAWAHDDTELAGDGVGSAVVRRLAWNAAFIRLPFCVAMTNYDALALFDAASITAEVGHWDRYLWYYGDTDLYQRCALAGLMRLEMPTIRPGVLHAVAGTRGQLKGTAQMRFERGTYEVLKTISRLKGWSHEIQEMEKGQTIDVRITLQPTPVAVMPFHTLLGEVVANISRAVGVPFQARQMELQNWALSEPGQLEVRAAVVSLGPAEEGRRRRGETGGTRAPWVLFRREPLQRALNPDSGAVVDRLPFMV